MNMMQEDIVEELEIIQIMPDDVSRSNRLGVLIEDLKRRPVIDKQLLRQKLDEEEKRIDYDFNADMAVDMIERLGGLCK